MKCIFCDNQYPGICAECYNKDMSRRDKLIAKLEAEIDDLQKEVKGYRSWESSVNEALNMGDGVYRP